MNNHQLKSVFLQFLFVIAVGFPLSSQSAMAACSDMAAPGVDWNDCRKRNLIISGSNLENANLVQSDLSSSDLEKSNLTRANLRKSNLLRANFSFVTAMSADFRNSLGYRAIFHAADLFGANFEKSEMHRADFTGANLTNANLSRAEFGRVDFSDATLTGATFELSNLARADLRKIKIDGQLPLQGAFLFQTRIEGMDLSQFSGLAQWQIDMSCGDANTKLPVDLVRPASWPCSDKN